MTWKLNGTTQNHQLYKITAPEGGTFNFITLKQQPNGPRRGHNFDTKVRTESSIKGMDFLAARSAALIYVSTQGSQSEPRTSSVPRKARHVLFLS